MSVKNLFKPAALALVFMAAPAHAKDCQFSEQPQLLGEMLVQGDGAGGYLACDFKTGQLVEYSGFLPKGRGEEFEIPRQERREAQENYGGGAYGFYSQQPAYQQGYAPNTYNAVPVRPVDCQYSDGSIRPCPGQ